MKKSRVFFTVGVIALTLFLVVFSSGCNNSNLKSKKYLIATDLGYAPFVFQNNNETIGIDIDILKAVAEDQNFTYEFRHLGFSGAITALETNQVDGVIAGMIITNERKLKYDFSNGYYESGIVMATNISNQEIKGYEDLKGRKVAVKTGTEGARFAESIKNKYGFDTKNFDDTPSMYEEVKIKNSAVCFEDYPIVEYSIEHGAELKLVNDKIESGSSYGFAVMKGKNQELLEKFNKGLENIKQNGKYDEIVGRYVK